MALGAYTEPHSRLPGGDYVEKEKVPHGDLNQIVTNQRNLWNQVRGTAAVMDFVYDAKKYVSQELTTSWVTLHTNDGGVGDPLSLSYNPGSPVLAAADLVVGNVGPLAVIVTATGTPAPTVQVRTVITQAAVSVVFLREIIQPIPGVTVELPLDFPFVYKSTATSAIDIKVEARLKVSTTCVCRIDTPGFVNSDQAYGNTPSYPLLHQWLYFQHLRRAPQ